jgi:hypothetical protein
VYEGKAGPCPVTVEANQTWHVLQLRRLPDAWKDDRCRIGREDLTAILQGAFAALAESGDPTRYHSVFLGRIIYHEWLGRYLVERSLVHEDWSTESGRPKNGKMINELVNEILGEPAILDVLNPPIADAGYAMTGMSCEKVLVSNKNTKKFEPEWTPEGKRVPFDAMCWMVLSAPQRPE